jgi:hypothetical protein
MPYSTGTASSPTDLLQKLVAWLSGAVGWTTDLSAVQGAGWRAHLHLNGNYVHLRALMNEGSGQGFNNMTTAGYAICIYTSSSFNSASAWNSQPGTPSYQNGSSTLVVGAGMNLPSGAIQNYYFFSDATGDNIVVVVEKTPGVYVYIGWGASLLKAGSYSNGQYFFGSSQGFYCCSPSQTGEGFTTTSLPIGKHNDPNGVPCVYVRVDIDTFTGKWIAVSDSVTATQGYTGKNGASSIPGPSGLTRAEIARYASSNGSTINFYSRQTSNLDGRANLLPPLLWGARDVSGYSLLGAIPNVFYSNGVGNGFSNAAEYTLGTTVYKMFPFFAVVKQ